MAGTYLKDQVNRVPNQGAGKQAGAGKPPVAGAGKPPVAGGPSAAGRSQAVR